MHRRHFLKSLGLFSALCCCPLGAAESFELIETDPKCSHKSFKIIYRDLRRLQAKENDLSPKEQLEDARAWLGGSPRFQPKLAKSGRWGTASHKGKDVKVRIIEPPGASRGVVLSIHGGGWTMGAATSDETFNEALVKERQVTVVSPEYRLAPEHPYPAGPDDCEVTARWLLERSLEEFGTNKLGIIGFSAGAHLAALTLTRLGRLERERFRYACFFYGVFNLARNWRWRNLKDRDYPDLSPSAMDVNLARFLPGLSDEERKQAIYSPVNGELYNMPPALFLVGSNDLLYHDTLGMANNWVRFGNPAELVVYQGAPHGFNGYPVEWHLNPNQYARDFFQL